METSLQTSPAQAERGHSRPAPRVRQPASTVSHARRTPIIAAFVVWMLLLGTGIVFVVSIVVRLNASSQVFVDAIVPQIVTGWNAQPLREHGAIEFHRAASARRLETFFKLMRDRLGPLKEYRGAKGGVHFAANYPQGILITANFRADATFENAEAPIQVRLIRQNGEWRILYFYVHSNLLADRHAEAAPPPAEP